MTEFFFSKPSMLGKLRPSSTKSFHDMVALTWTEKKLKAHSFQEVGSDLAQAQLSKCQSQPLFLTLTPNSTRLQG